MSLLVTGSIGIDTVETPVGRADEVIGGTAVQYCYSAALFGPVRLVGVVGEDFPEHFHKILQREGVDLAGLEIRQGSKTFRWTGRYVGDMNEAETRDVKLNVLEEAAPKVPAAFRDSKFVFLANTHPTLQRELLDQVAEPKLTVCDTMNLWIETERNELLKTLQVVDGVVLTEGETRLLTEVTNLVKAGRLILEYGPKFVVIKKGEHGALLFTEGDPISLPAFPSEDLVDPTGAGDSFAGGMMGYLASRGEWDPPTLKRAIAHGMVTASFQIEEFSLRRMEHLKRKEVDDRLQQYRRMITLE